MKEKITSYKLDEVASQEKLLANDINSFIEYFYCDKIYL